MSEQQTVRLFSRAARNYSVTVRFDQVVLAPADPWDPCQHWFKDTRHGDQVKDQDGNPGFALINKATGEAIQHPAEKLQPVKLVAYNPDTLDESVLWSGRSSEGAEFHAIRKVTDKSLNLDAFHGDDLHGGVRDGTVLVLSDWTQGKNQWWQMTPYGSEVKTWDVVNKVYTRADTDYSLTIKDGKVEIAKTNVWDQTQYWIKDAKYGAQVKDSEGFPSFALVNKATGQALKHSETGLPVQLVQYNPDEMDKSILWTSGGELGDGYRAIRRADDTTLVLDVKGGDMNDGTPIILYKWQAGNNERWRIRPYYTIRH